MLKLFLRRYKETNGAHGDGRGAFDAIGDLFSGQMSLTRYLELDDHSITTVLKGACRSADATLAGLADGLLNRRLYKALDVTAFASANGLARLVELNERVQRRMEHLRLDPRYTFVEDTASDTPYEPYTPDVERPGRQIFVESSEGRIVELSTVSEALLQLRKPYTMIRYYFPASFRDEVRRIASATLRER
jgi:HD superfamily phosphohydrolase